jgi:excisionase family DNA binding protein
MVMETWVATRAAAITAGPQQRRDRTTRGGDVRKAAAAELACSGFASRSELEQWLALCSWLDDPDSDPSAYVWLPDGTGWVPVAAVEVSTGRRRSAVELPPNGAPRFLTLQEAGAMVRAAPETIRYWIWQGRLQAYKPGGAVLVREDELLELCNSPKTRQNLRAPTRRQSGVVRR